MAEKKKGKQKKLEEETPSKEEYAVAKYLRFGLPVREGKLHGMEVKCFFGNAAVDKLMESKWSATNNKKDPLFTTRASCVSYMLGLLQKGLFHRAEREKRKKDKDKTDKVKKKKKERDGEKEEAVKPDEELRERKGKKDKKGKKEKEPETNGEEVEKKETEKKSEKKEEKEKKKKEKRLKLIMPEEQFFEDSEEVYVWIYDPVNAKTFFIGLLMVLGAIGLCMFPLWPEEVRVGVYYLSLSAAGFVGFILFLVVVRLILFCIVWTLTMGVHHFWFLPNLTEDVGFFDSFKPLYHHEKVTGEAKSKDKKKKKKKGEGDGENEEESKDSEEKKDKSSDRDDSDEFEVIYSVMLTKSEDVADREGGEENVDNEEDTENNGLDDEEEEDDNQDDENGDSEEEEDEEDTEKEDKKSK